MWSSVHSAACTFVFAFLLTPFAAGQSSMPSSPAPVRFETQLVRADSPRPHYRHRHRPPTMKTSAADLLATPLVPADFRASQVSSVAVVY